MGSDLKILTEMREMAPLNVESNKDGDKMTEDDRIKAERFETEVLKIKHSLSDRLPWPLSVRIVLLAHLKFIKYHNSLDWSFRNTAKLLNKPDSQIKTAIEMAKMLETYPDLAKITNKRRAWRILKMFQYLPSDNLRLKIAQEIQNQLVKERRSTYDELAGNLGEMTL